MNKFTQFIRVIQIFPFKCTFLKSALKILICVIKIYISQLWLQKIFLHWAGRVVFSSRWSASTIWICVFPSAAFINMVSMVETENGDIIRFSEGFLSRAFLYMSASNAILALTLYSKLERFWYLSEQNWSLLFLLIAFILFSILSTFCVKELSTFFTFFANCLIVFLSVLSRRLFPFLGLFDLDFADFFVFPCFPLTLSFTLTSLPPSHIFKFNSLIRGSRQRLAKATGTEIRKETSTKYLIAWKSSDIWLLFKILLFPLMAHLAS